jgi:hypothetical protein
MDRNKIIWTDMIDEQNEKFSIGLLRNFEYNNKKYAVIVYEIDFNEILDEIDQDFEILRCDILANGEEILNEIEDLEEFDNVCEVLFDIYDNELEEDKEKE